MEPTKREPDPMLRKLYPNLSDEELLNAEEKFDEYLEFTVRLHRRIATDPETYQKFKDF
jgi:hypothetical protein